MKTGTMIIAILAAANLCVANELQQQYEKAYFLETAKGQTEEAIAIYKAIAEAEPRDENKTTIKQSLLRLLHMATVRKDESIIMECHEKLIGRTDTTIQELVDATKDGGTVYIPAGRHEGTITIGKKLTLKGTDRETCIMEATSDKPLIHVPKKQEVVIESLTLKSQLETSERRDPPGCALLAQDATVTVRDCRIIALGSIKRSPLGVLVQGFSEVELLDSYFKGYDNPILYGEGSEGLVKGCIVNDPGHCGFISHADSEVVIEGNVFTDSGYHGVRSTGGTIHVKNNLIINNRRCGIYLGNKSAKGEITNNAIVGNGSGISSFGSSEFDIENNVLLNGSSGIATRGSCRLSIKNNIIAGNEETGFAVYEGGNEKFRVGKNTFWNNGTPSTDFNLPRSTIEEDPKFEEPGAGNFAAGNKVVEKAEHGLTDPEPISRLWKKYVELDAENAKALSEEIGTLMAVSKKQEKSALQSKIDGFDMDDGDLKSVIRTFGEPERYFWGDKTYKKNNRPNTYLISYPNGLRILMSNGEIEEFRFEKKTDYSIAGITVGTPLDQVIDILGEPNRTVSGRVCTFEEGVLFRNCTGDDGRSKFNYYSAKGLRLFFYQDKVTALYITDNTILAEK